MGDAALRLARYSDLGLRWGILCKGRQVRVKLLPRTLRDAETRQYMLLWECTVASSQDIGSLPICRSTMETCQSLAWLVGTNFPSLPSLPQYCDVNPGPGKEALFPYLVCRPWEILVQHLGISSSFIPTITKSNSFHLLSPVSQPLHQTLGSNILILLLPITLQNGWYF